MARNNGDDAEGGVHNVNAAAGPNDQEPPAAAVQENNEEPSLLEQLMDRIRHFLPEGMIDEEMARRLLEASAGNVDVAIPLYLDHYFASMGNDGRARRPAQDNPEELPRRVRRRLEDQLEEHAEADVNDNNVNVNDEEANNDDDAPAAEGDEEMPPPDVPENQHHAAARVQDDAEEEEDDNNNGEGAAVSDDEGLQRASRRSRRRPRIRGLAQGGNIPAADAPLLRNISMEAGSELEQQLNEAIQDPTYQNQVSVKKEEEDEDDLDDDFLCDHDWIFQEDSSSSSAMPPELLLWGDPASKFVSSHEANENAENAGNAPPVAEGSNVVAEDDDDEDGEDEAPVEIPKEGIPKTWIRAGFTASPCGTGLVTQPPDDDDITLIRWRQSQNGGSHNIAPPPYHCRGVTALLSVVTAIMYSGTSIQGSTVNCNSTRTPFSELSEEERKREFDSRLVDALSSLLFIAAKASLERKKRALAKRRLVSPPESGENDKIREQMIERKLQLIPTCRFDDDNGSGDGSIVEGQLAQIATSYTRIEDIRSYVVSTMRSFTKKGGCALFLETIMRIHGKTCVERMMRSSCRRAGLSTKKVLIECECEQRQKKLSQAPYGASNHPVEEALPLDHTCISTELVTLILTGEVHSTLEGWSTGSLGIGLLTNEPGEVDRRLMNPEKPVWLLRGDTCYSVAWLDGNKEQAESVSRGDSPGTLHHWNGWFGDRHKSSMRLIAARREWSPPVFSKMRAVGPERKTVSDGILEHRREKTHIVSSDEHGEAESAEQTVTKEEIDQVHVHPEDEKLYPNEFRQWRFDMGLSTAPEKVKEEGDIKIGQCGKEHQLHWIPFYRLDERQQRIVEMKVSPKIKRILWTRWPGATIDRFKPEDDDTPPAV